MMNRIPMALELVLLLGLILILAIPARGADVSVTTLTVEYKTNPLGISVLQPRLSWKLVSSDRDVMQSAYQIQVAEHEADLRRGRNLVWDSKRVAADASVNLTYEGPALEAGTRYHWRVRIWDADGDASDWSVPAWWEMGLLDGSDWEARWIEPDWEPDISEPQPSPFLRREFRIDDDVASARLYATAHGLYEMYLNGRRVGEALFTPGWTAYHDRLQYQTFDVTDLVQNGDNALGAMMGDGWYRGYIGWGGNRNAYGTALALLAQLEVTYEDGRTEVVVKTDDGWTVTTGPILMSDLYMGETYDARLEIDGWAAAGFSDGDWQAVRIADHDKTRLFGQVAPDVHRIQTLEPMSIFTTPEGDKVVDMGQNMVGWVRLRAAGAPGTEITLRHAEVLDADGNFYTDNLRSAAQKTVYILKGGGEEVFEPHFTFQGFRYVAVDGYPGELTLDDLAGVVIHSDMAPTGHFETSHPLINRLQHNIVWGQKGNFLDVPTDCPQRDERLGWTGDAQVFAPTATFNMHVPAFFTKWLGDLAADQTEEGRIPHVVPDVLDAGGATGWADAGIIVPWVMYRRYGDLRILERQYDSMKAWVEYMRARAAQDETEYLWDEGSHFGDWLAYSTNSPGYPGASTNTDLIATAYFAHSSDLLSQTAALLGRDDDADEYAVLRDAVTAAFRQEFVTPRARLSSDTQTAYVLALAFDLLPEDQREEAARRLGEEVQERGHLTTGFLGTPDLTHVLGENGYLDEAYTLLLRTEYPSWLYPVTMDATTIWERWDGIKADGTFQDVGMNSFNHYAYGAVGDWLYGVVAGIKPLEPGYKRISIAPEPGGALTFARARHDSPYGVVESSWHRSGASFELDVTVPANTTALVRLPHASGVDVSEGDRPVDGEVDGDDLVVELGSGTYAFSYANDALIPEEPEEDDDAQEQADEEEVPESFDRETTLADLIAHEEARAVLVEELPQLMNSFWLSQTMGFSLERAAGVIPVDIAESELAAVDAALQSIQP